MIVKTIRTPIAILLISIYFYTIIDGYYKYSLYNLKVSTVVGIVSPKIVSKSPSMNSDIASYDLSPKIYITKYLCNCTSDYP